MNNNIVETGIAWLDEALQGGLSRGSMTLIAGNPGTGKTLLSGEFLYRGASQGENCLYVSLSEGRHSFLEYMARMGRDLMAEDAWSRLEVMDLVTVKEEGLEILVEMITSHLEATQSKRLVIDSFTALSNAFRETIDARVTLHILSKILTQTICTTLLVTEIPTGSEKIGLDVGVRGRRHHSSQKKDPERQRIQGAGDSQDEMHPHREAVTRLHATQRLPRTTAIQEQASQ